MVVWLQNGLVARGHWCIFSVTLRSLFEGVLSYCCVVIFFSQGDFVTIVDLPEGTHQYKFMVDGAWKTISSEVQLLLV